MLIVFLLDPAVAQPVFTVYDDALLEAVPGSWYQGGVGAPSVVYRRRHDDYVMFFETMQVAPDTTCPAGQWAVGVARSDDGLSWVVDPAPLLGPAAGTYHACVVAHPSALVDDDGESVHLWFKAEQQRRPCLGLPTPLPWGCTQYTGVGYVRVGADLATLEQTVAAPVLAVDRFGFPSVTRADGEYQMLIAKVPDFWLARSTAPDSGWALAQATPVMTHGATSWTLDELFNPALLCTDDAVFGHTVFFGGRDNAGASIVYAGWGDAISTDALSWLVNTTPYFDWTGNQDWRHWDAVGLGNEVLIWFSEKDPGGVPRIGYAGTVAAWHDWEVESRTCPQPGDWWQIPPGTPIVDALDELRSLVRTVADRPSTPAGAAADLETDVIAELDDALGEVLKGHPHHIGEALELALDRLLDIEATYGFDTSFLQSQVAALALYALELQLDRAEAIAGPNDVDVIDALAHYDLAYAAFQSGDWTTVTAEARAGLDDARDQRRIGNWCPAVQGEPYLEALCRLQDVHADVAALAAANPTVTRVRDARNKIGEALGHVADTDVKEATKKLREAAERLDAAAIDTTAQLDLLAFETSLLTRQFVDDAAIAGLDPVAVADADVAWNDGEALRLAGDYVGAMLAYEDAAALVSP